MKTLDLTNPKAALLILQTTVIVVVFPCLRALQCSVNLLIFPVSEAVCHYGFVYLCLFITVCRYASGVSTTV